MQLHSTTSGLFVFVLTSIACAQDASTTQPTDARNNSVEVVQYHLDPQPHPVTVDPSRFVTSRTSQIELPLPEEKDAFSFAVFGDRTGGPPEGIKILRQAVADVNLFEPDMVMTVGDLIQGYNESGPWMVQMREYKDVMSRLLCPWFPVAGNHDVYYRGPNPPRNEHDQNYEMHFGPLWYAFSHKDCWFIVLYSDEGNPQTGEKNFNKPECQRISPEQFSWLKETLSKAKSARHVFCFLHHPRWLGNNYGDDWDRVHAELAKTGNVRVVFAGHIHRMRYDGPRDGIEYVTLATVGGGQSGVAPRAGFLHHYHIVTVRDQQIAMASLPVGEVSDVREVTGELSSEVFRLASQSPTFNRRPHFDRDGKTEEPLIVEFRNPTKRSAEFTIHVESEDPRWGCLPDHLHFKVAAGESVSKELDLHHFESGVDQLYRTPELIIETDYLAESARVPLAERRFAIPVQIDLPTLPRSDVNRAMATSYGNCLAVDSNLINMPDGPMTVECWMKANAFTDRMALVAKTESSEFGLYTSGGLPYFSIFLNGRYVEPQAIDTRLKVNQWYHVAGVYDGQEVRTYVDGQVVAREQASGKRKKNGLSLMVGADVTSRNLADSFFIGMIDEVRLSTVARYQGDSFQPKRTWEPDDQTVLLLDQDTILGPFVVDRSKSAAHATRIGNPRFVETQLAP